MSLQSRQELLLSLRPQYLNASPGEKKQLLDGLVTATGYNRKYAVTLLSKGINKKTEGKRKRQGKYDQSVVDALLIVWKAAYRVCSKRLIPFIPVLIESLIRYGHFAGRLLVSASESPWWKLRAYFLKKAEYCKDLLTDARVRCQ